MLPSSKCVFVTVGSTKFDDLAHTVLSPEVLDSLRARQFRKLVFQCGNSNIEDIVPTSSAADEWNWTDEGRNIEIFVWRFRPELDKYFREADLVISHAGTFQYMSTR
jgi:UDP-N-acetylglucosamine transferase subunit ALG13